MNGSTGTVTRVNGPVVHISGLGSCTRFEYVEVGDVHLPGEILTVWHDHVVAQLYEYSGGLEVGDRAWAMGHPLTVRLVPGLLGGIYDGLLRPLQGLDVFLPPRSFGQSRSGEHPFEPTVRENAQLSPGDEIGRVATPGGLDHLVLVPPQVSGRASQIAPPGSYQATDPVALVGDVPISLGDNWPIRRARPHMGRRQERVPFRTGQRVLDTLAPIASGSSATVIGGFGEGKTVLLEQIAKWGGADVIIYVGCGERGNELTDLIEELGELDDPITGRRLMERTIILANTSNMPVMAREASIYTAVTVAEYYRDMGYHVVIIADSTSRWAEAQRELASRTGAIPAEEGYPADLPSALAAFYQRAGSVTTLGGREGTVTIVTSVSPPGGDVTEPVSAHTRRFVQAVWSLDRDLAYARHYPAISWTSSFTRDGDAIAAYHATHDDPEWVTRRSRLHSLLAGADRLQDIADLVGLPALPAEERLTLLGGRLIREGILQQSAMSKNDSTCSAAKQAALAEAVLGVHEAASAVLEAGVPVSLIEEFDYGPVIRAKDTVGPEDAAGVAAIAETVVDSMKAMAP